MTTLTIFENVLTFHSGMSMRLAYDLGLHLDMATYVQRGSMTPIEAKVRRIAFWGSYIADQ